jgi:hypothetical protein
MSTTRTDTCTGEIAGMVLIEDMTEELAAVV